MGIGEAVAGAKPTMVDVQAMPPMWPQTMQALARLDRRRHIVDPRDSGMMEGQLFSKEHTFADSGHFMELLNRSGSGDSHQASLARLYEDRQHHAVTLLRQQLDALNMERLEAERRQLQILEELAYEPLPFTGGNEALPLCEDSFGDGSFLHGDDGPSSWSSVPGSESCVSDADAGVSGGDPVADYWRGRARTYAKLLSDSIRREELLVQQLSQFAGSPAAASPPPLEELRQQLHRFDNFLRFSLRKAPVVVAHQDNELRYRFIYNAFPTLTEEEVIGKTDIEIYKGVGVAELMEFKREVLRKGCPEQREISFNTDLFGEKTFLVAVEPVLSLAGEPMGLNYIAMDVSEQVDKRERLARIREEVAVQKAMETELHKTIHITEETMRAKQMLATMSHEIRSPLSGVVSMAEVLATTQLDAEQRQLVEVMVSSGDLVLQLINDILDLSKVQSGAMKFEAKKFRPREVVKHVLQMALASMQNKSLVLEGRIYDDVPLEVIGDVLRIRQVFTNLVSNAIKFTHEGNVTIDVHMVAQPSPGDDHADAASCFVSTHPATSSSGGAAAASRCAPRVKFAPLFVHHESLRRASRLDVLSRPLTTRHTAPATLGGNGEIADPVIEDTVWLHCDIRDTGIGIPEEALPSLFEKYTQVSTTHARKYGGTGLGLAICKNLVELMGGSLTVASKENQGSTFSFQLPLRVVREESVSTGQLSEEVYDMMTNEALREDEAEKLASTKKVGYFHFTSKVSAPQASSPAAASAAASQQTPSRTSSSLMANSLTCSASASSSSEQYFSSKPTSPLTPRRRLGGGNAPQQPAPLGFFQDSSPEFMDVDSRVPDYMGYLPGLSMPQCRSPGPLSQQEGSSSWLPSPRVHDPHSSRKTAAAARKLPERPAPLLPAAARKLPEQPAPLLPAATIPPLRAQRLSRILLAEDNKVNVMVAQSMLKRLGHKLEVVSNGAEALQALQHKSYDVILMDVCMPVMDGLEATRRIRRFERTGSWEAAAEEGAEAASSNDAPPDGAPRFAGPRRRRVPIIAMTANALADNMLECYTHGMDSFIAKPVTFTKLEQVLRQFIPCLDRTGSSSGPPLEDLQR